MVVGMSNSAVYVLNLHTRRTSLHWQTRGLSPRCVSTDGRRILVSGDVGGATWLPNWRAFGALPEQQRVASLHPPTDSDHPMPRSVTACNNYMWCNKIIRGGFVGGSLDKAVYLPYARRHAL